MGSESYRWFGAFCFPHKTMNMIEILILVILSMLVGGAVVHHDHGKMHGLYIGAGAIFIFTLLWLVIHH
jgi:hypothetical protein